MTYPTEIKLLTVPEAGSLRSGSQQIRLFPQASLLGLQVAAFSLCLSLCVHRPAVSLCPSFLLEEHQSDRIMTLPERLVLT